MRLQILLVLILAAQPTREDFRYQSGRPPDIRQKSAETRDGVSLRDIDFASDSGGRTSAYLVTPAGAGPFSAALFVHWYEPQSKDSNRSQFLSQAIDLAHSGTVSLLIETMWSDPKWFDTRNPAEDFDRSVQQVKELRRALDVLLAQPGIDRRRVAYVGHDFGMMFGAVLAGIDPRPTCFALQAGTASFSDWYLLGSKLQGAARQNVIDRLAPLDPVRYLPQTRRPVLLQFGKDDPYVPRKTAEAIFQAAREPKKILWYDAGHGLNAAAIRDREAWLRSRLASAASSN